MEQRIIFVRHGALPEEVAHALVGNCEVPLSAQGRAEALACGSYLAEQRVDVAYSGTLRRVVETRELAESRAANLPQAISDPRLNEMDFGEWNLLPASDFPFADWDFGDPAFGFPGGDTMATFMERTRAAYADILASGAQSIVIFSHGGVIMGLLADILGISRSGQFNLWVERGSIAEVSYKHGRSRLYRVFRPLDFLEK